MSKQSKRRQRHKLRAAIEQNDILQLVVDVEITASGGEAKPVRCEIHAYGGEPMPIANYGLTLIDLGGLDTSHPVQILAEHLDSIDGLLGTGVATKTKTDLRVSATLTRANPMTERIVAMAKDGVMFAASVGVWPEKRTLIYEGETVTANGKTFTAPRGGLIYIRRGVLKETSLVAIGADATASVAIAASQKRNSINMNTSNTENLIPDELRVAWARDGLTDVDRISLRASGAKIQNPHLQSEVPALVVASAGNFAKFDAGMLAIENRDLELRLLKAKMPKAPGVYGSPRDNATPNVIEAALCLNAGISKPEDHFDEQVLDVASGQQFRNYGLQQLLMSAAIENGYTHQPGERVHRGNLRTVLQTALPAVPIQASGFSTIDVSGILSNTANKILLSGFNLVPQPWREVASIRTVTDFKQVTAYRMTADLEYEELPPAGEIKHGTLGEESYTMQAKTYAKMLALTRTDIINDDLGAFDDLRTRLGMGAVLKMNKVFWTLWINNSSFFTAGRLNYQEGANTNFSEAGLNTAVQLFREMKGPDGNLLGLVPKKVIVPPALEASAALMHKSTELRDTTASTKTLTTNLYYDRFVPVVVPELGNSDYTGYGDKIWYLICDPAILATAAMCFLNGQQSPTIESADADFNTLGIQLRGYHDWGVAMTEWRAGVKSKGEA